MGRRRDDEGGLFGESLGDVAQPHKLARRENPETSKEAAREIAPKLGELHLEVLGMLVESPGNTTSELTKKFEPSGDNRRIGRRLPELERRDLAIRGAPRPCRETGKKAATWFASERGEKFYREAGKEST